MSWILLLAYLAIALGFFVFFRFFAFDKSGKIGSQAVLCLLWPLVAGGVMLYFAGKCFVCAARKACEACSKRSAE